MLELKEKPSIYKSTHSLVYSCDYHVIWCTKYRRPVLVSPIAERLKTLIYEQQEVYEYEVHACEVMDDHVHLLISSSPQLAPASVVGKIKGYTSHVLRDVFPQLKSRIPSLWTRSKFIASTGGVTLEVLRKYVEDQRGK